MDINGAVALLGGGNFAEILNVAAATDGGVAGKNKKGTLKLINGVKIQWDSVPVAANATTEFALPEEYTEDHYAVLVQHTGSVTTGGSEQECAGWVPAGDNKLSHVELMQINDSQRELTFWSIGKDYAPLQPILHTKAIETNFGGSEWLMSSDAEAASGVGFADAWSVRMTLQNTNAAINSYLFQCDSTTTNASAILILWLGASANDPIQVYVRDSFSTGRAMKDYRFDAPIDVAEKVNFVVTYEGTTFGHAIGRLKLYLDGAEVAPTIITEGTPYAMTDTPLGREIRVGNLGTSNFNQFNGELHSTAVWRRELSAAECLALDNSGSPHTMDPRFNKGDYQGQLDLIHYWMHGHNSADIGKDYGVHGPSKLDLITNASNITVADIVDY